MTPRRGGSVSGRAGRGRTNDRSRESIPDHCRPAGSLAVDFVNTESCPACRVGDALDTPEDATRWRRAHPELPSVGLSQADLAQLRTLRRELRLLLGTAAGGRNPSAAGMRRLAQILRRSSTHLELNSDQGRVTLFETFGPMGVRGRWEALLGRSAAELLAGPERNRLRQCAGPDCVHLLLAHSRGQLWCSPTGCGNRARVARHYRRRSTTPASRLPRSR